MHKEGKKKPKIINIVALVIVLVMIGIATPTIISIINLETEANTLYYQIQTQTSALNDLNTKGKQVEKIGDEVSKLKDSLSYNVQDGLYTAALLQKATSEGVAIKNYNMGDTQEVKGITVIPLDIEFEGSYSSIYNIVKYMEKSKVFTQVQDINMVDTNKLKSEANLANGGMNLKVSIALYSKDNANKSYSDAIR